FYWKGLHVPFIAPWSGEESPSSTLVVINGVGGLGLGYADEVPTIDRRNGVLWKRCSAAPGAGRPNLAGVHPLRQRQAMSHLVCQVCGTSTFDTNFARWGERHLFVVRDVGGQSIHEGERTRTPPICVPCAHEAVRDCSHLRRGHTAALVNRPQPWGVAGIVYDPDTLQAIKVQSPDGLTEVAYDSPLIRWTVAHRDVATLHGCTTVSLEHLSAQEVTA
ncbi:hypothetical protein, partial [Streptomyces chryseus]